MAIDLKKIRERLTKLEETNNTRKLLWKPEPGEQVIRIVPYIHTPDDPFIELYFHYNVGKKNNYLSLKSFNEADPIVEFSETLKSSGSTEDFKLGRRIEPKMRTFVPVIVRGKENEGVKFWGFGKNIYESLLTTISDPDWGDITHPITGRDITVTFKTAEEVRKNYPETTVRVKPNSTRVSEDKKVIGSIKNQPKITEVFKVPTYDMLKEELETWMSGDDSEESEEKPANVLTDNLPPKPEYKKPIVEDAVKSTPVAESAPVASPPSPDKSKSIEDALASLLDE